MPSLAQIYGEFRVCWKMSAPHGKVVEIGAGLGWNEGIATAALHELKRTGREAWVEHQDPTTGEWKKW